MLVVSECSGQGSVLAGAANSLGASCSLIFCVTQDTNSNGGRLDVRFQASGRILVPEAAPSLLLSHLNLDFYPNVRITQSAQESQRNV